jgi:methylmalonyl-CoA mutase N-terminal domain/subunit
MPDSEKLFNPESIQNIKKNKQTWQARTSASSNEKQDDCRTLSGIPVKMLYTPDDVSDLNYHKDLGLPGEEPYVRGVYPNMYRGRGWTLRQLAGFGPAEETNKRYRFLRDQ